MGRSSIFETEGFLQGVLMMGCPALDVGDVGLRVSSPRIVRAMIPVKGMLVPCFERGAVR